MYAFLTAVTIYMAVHRPGDPGKQQGTPGGTFLSMSTGTRLYPHRPGNPEFSTILPLFKQENLYLADI